MFIGVNYRICCNTETASQPLTITGDCHGSSWMVWLISRLETNRERRWYCSTFSVGLGITTHFQPDSDNRLSLSNAFVSASEWFKTIVLGKPFGDLWPFWVSEEHVEEFRSEFTPRCFYWEGPLLSPGVPSWGHPSRLPPRSEISLVPACQTSTSASCSQRRPMATWKVKQNAFLFSDFSTFHLNLSAFVRFSVLCCDWSSQRFLSYYGRVWWKSIKWVPIACKPYLCLSE